MSTFLSARPSTGTPVQPSDSDVDHMERGELDWDWISGLKLQAQKHQVEKYQLVDETANGEADVFPQGRRSNLHLVISQCRDVDGIIYDRPPAINKTSSLRSATPITAEKRFPGQVAVNVPHTARPSTRTPVQQSVEERMRGTVPEIQTRKHQREEDRARRAFCETAVEESDEYSVKDTSGEDAVTLPFKSPNANVIVAHFKYLHGTQFLLFLADFGSLKGKNWLTGEVVDYYLKYLTNGKSNVYVLDHFIGGFIISNDVRMYEHLLKTVSFKDFDMILGAAIVNQVHWVLLVIDVQRSEIMILDSSSFSSAETHTRNTCLAMRRYFEIRYKHTRSSDLEGVDWKPVAVEHPLQHPQDSSSCGIFVIKYAEWLLSKTTLQFQTDEKSIQKYRDEIGQSILQNSDKLDNICHHCGLVNERHKWVGCNVCNRCSHLRCLAIEEKKALMGMRKWECSLCINRRMR